MFTRMLSFTILLDMKLHDLVYITWFWHDMNYTVQTQYYGLRIIMKLICLTYNFETYTEA